MFSEKLLSRRADERLFHASTLLVRQMQNVADRLMSVFLAGRRIDGTRTEGDLWRFFHRWAI